MTDLNFIKTALQDYRVGAITSTTKFAIKKILNEMPLHASTIIEYGPGDGVITKEILQKLPAEGRLVAIETNDAFVDVLNRINDPRLLVLHDDATRVMADIATLDLPQIDTIVSGIPFTYFKPEIREMLVAQTARALAPGGRFLVYQYSLLLMPVLKKHFKNVRVNFEPLNFPPYFIMSAEI